MANRLAPVDVRVADDGTVWHVGDPAAWGKGALEKASPRESMRLLEADEIRFIGPDHVQDSHLNFQAHLVALSLEERALIERALKCLLAQPGSDEAESFTQVMDLIERIAVED
jgi:hypothetical protein